MEQRDNFGDVPLGIAVLTGHIEIVRLLLDYVEANVEDVRGFLETHTPLPEAAEKRNVDILQLLLKHGADPEVIVMMMRHHLI